MNARPVTRYRTPRYPTRLEVLADRALLEKHLPPAWKSCAEMAGVVTLLLATNSLTGLSQELKGGVRGKPAVVAPIFEHGEGRGAVGCVAVNPPIFLSEQDAMQVIREQMAKAGVALSATHVPFPEAMLQQFRQEWSGDDPGPKLVPTGKTKVLVLDAMDPNKRVGVEFVSSRNYFDLGGEQSRSSGQGYNFKGIAASVDKSVAKGHNIYFGAFYDPVTPSRGDEETSRRSRNLYLERSKLTDPQLIAQKDAEIKRAYDEMLASARARSREMLEEQVKDFIDWLKGQGVI